MHCLVLNFAACLTAGKTKHVFQQDQECDGDEVLSRERAKVVSRELVTNVE